MDVTVAQFLQLFVLAFGCEFIDSAFGMGYGTILSPVLIIMGFEPIVAVPAVLLSQAFGGLTASVFHHRFENASFSKGSRDLRVVLVISAFGIVAAIFAAALALKLPRVYVKTYIGLLVFVMGLLLIAQRRFRFTWGKMIGLGILSAFNKGLSGGGFGPVITGGQIISGQEHRNAIAATTLSEAPICLVGFLTYTIGRAVTELEPPVWNQPIADLFGRMFSARIFQWELVLALLLGSIFVAPFGAFTTKLMRTERITTFLGVLISSLGIWTLWKTFA